MTPDQTDQILALLLSANVLNKLEETSPDVWAGALRDIEFPDALQAAANLIRTNQWVKIADVIAAVRKHRDDTATCYQGPGLPAEVPDADPDDIPAYLAALRAQRTRAAIGHQLKPRPIAAAIAGIGLTPNPDVASVRRPGPLGISCSTCKAAIGRQCKTPHGKPRSPHTARREAAGVRQ